MAIIVKEKPKSRKLAARSAEFAYIILNAPSQEAAYFALVEAVGLTYGGLVIDVGGVDVDEVYPGIYDGTAKFVPPEKKEQKEQQELVPEPGDPAEFSFDVGGGMFRLTNSLGTRAYAANWPPFNKPPDFRGAIGVTKEGVEGCDVPVCEYKWEEKHVLRSSQITQAYIDGLELLYGRLNNATFRGKPPRHVRFMGATGSGTATSSKCPVTFRFESGKHLKEHTIGDITGIEKLPFEHLWVRYEEEHDLTAKAVTKRPSDVYVETIHYEGDFAKLGIGTQVIRLHP